MSRRKACVLCGRRGVGDTARCERHPLEPAPRGNSYESTRQAIAERDGWVCQICGEPIDRNATKGQPRALHIDHLDPRARGGSSDPSNLRATHSSCNLAKGDRPDEQPIRLS